MMIHSDHALLISAVRHRELVAAAKHYRRARDATQARDDAAQSRDGGHGRSDHRRAPAGRYR